MSVFQQPLWGRTRRPFLLLLVRPPCILDLSSNLIFRSRSCSMCMCILLSRSRLSRFLALGGLSPAQAWSNDPYHPQALSTRKGRTRTRIHTSSTCGVSFDNDAVSRKERRCWCHETVRTESPKQRQGKLGFVESTVVRALDPPRGSINALIQSITHGAPQTSSQCSHPVWYRRPGRWEKP